MTSGHRPPFSPRGLLGLCFASSERRERFKGSRNSRGRSVPSVVKEEKARGQAPGISVDIMCETSACGYKI